jgi:hypothetical protein
MHQQAAYAMQCTADGVLLLLLLLVEMLMDVFESCL